MIHVTVYHNQDSGFMPYEPGQRLKAVTSHWLPDMEPQAAAEWAFRTFNLDLDRLEWECDRKPLGELSFLAASVYRLLGHRSLSVGDVVKVGVMAPDAYYLACERVGFRELSPPPFASIINSVGLTAHKVYVKASGREVGG